jgi:hypothetical protein
MPIQDTSSPLAKTPFVQMRSIALAVLVLSLATLFGFGRLTLHPGDLLVGVQRNGRNDLTDAFLAYRQFPQAATNHFGQRAAWNPFSMWGRPWVGNPQSALNYPLYWLTDRIPWSTLLGWLMVLHHFWGGLGAFFLCRTYGLARGALVGGTVFLLAPYYVAHTGEGHLNQVVLVAWLPWALIAFERLRQARSGGVSLLALMLGVSIFCGHAQESVYLGMVLAAFVLGDAMRGIWLGQVRRAAELLLRFAGACVLAAGIAAVELIPAWLYIQQSIRESGVSVAESTQYALTFANLSQLFNPFALGSPQDYRGADGVYWETLCYFGVAPLLLAILGAVAGWRTYPVGRMVGLWGLGLVFAFGPNLPFYPLLCALLPPLAMFRVPGRAMFFVSLATAMLAAVGVQWLTRSDWGSRRRPNGTQSLDDRVDSHESARSRVPLPDSEAARRTSLVIVVLLFVCVGELSWHAWQILDTVPRESIRSGSPVAALLAERAPGCRVLADGQRLSDREAWHSGLQRLQAYEPVPLLVHAMVFEAASGRTDVMQRLMGFLPTSLEDCEPALLDMLAVRFAVTEPLAAELPAGWQRLAVGQIPAEFAPRGQSPPTIDFAVYENQRALPRAFVVGQVREILGRGEVETLRSIDPRSEILLARDLLPAGPRTAFQPAAIVEDRPDRVVIAATASGPGYLFLSDTWYPGWRAEVDGQPVPVLRANIAFRAVPVTGGDHRVVFRYDPPLLRLATWITWLSLLTAGVRLVPYDRTSRSNG